MIGTFVCWEEATTSIDMTATELVKDFGIRPTYSYSDLKSFFLDLLRSYQMKGL